MYVRGGGGDLIRPRYPYPRELTPFLFYLQAFYAYYEGDQPAFGTQGPSRSRALLLCTEAALLRLVALSHSCVCAWVSSTPPHHPPACSILVPTVPHTHPPTSPQVWRMHPWMQRSQKCSRAGAVVL